MGAAATLPAVVSHTAIAANFETRLIRPLANLAPFALFLRIILIEREAIAAS